MIWFLVIICILLFLLFLPVSLVAFYDGKFKFQIRILFLKFVVPFDKSPKKKSENKPVKKVKTDNKKFTSQLSDVKRILPKLLKRAFKVLSVKKLRLSVKVATDDPCDTALAFGTVNTLVYTTLNTTERFIKIKNKKISVSADYSDDTTEVDFEAVISTCLIKLIICLILLLKDEVIKL